MALPMIETGYKPEGALGGVFAGFNAANAEQGAELELIKQYLANQREVSSQPIDIEQLKQNLAAGAYKTTPEYQIGMRDTISGQGMSNLAAGRQKAATNEGDIRLALTNNQNGQFTADTLSKLNALKQQSIDAAGGGGQIGFQMQQPQSYQGGGTIRFPSPRAAPTGDNARTSGDASWQVTPQVQGQADDAAGRLSVTERQDPSYDLAEINRALASKNLNRTQRTILETQRDQLRRGLASLAQDVNTNNSPIVQQPPQRNGGITQGSPQYEAIMQSLVDQPELRAKLLVGDQKLDSAEFINERRIQAKLQEALNKARAVASKLPTMEQAQVQDIYSRLAQGVISSAEATGELNAWLNRKYDKPLQQGVTAQTGPNGIEIVDKDKQTPRVSSKTNAPATSDADLINKYLK